jgi:hypothetical protein
MLQNHTVLLASALLTLGAWTSPVSAQDNKANSIEAQTEEEDRPLAGYDAEQIATFFTLVSASADLDAALAPMIEAMFEPGEAEPEWRELGVDILAELDQLEGGREANLLREDDEEVLSVTDLSGKSAPDLSGFSSVVLRASPPEGTDERLYMGFEPGVWLELTMKRNSRGKAYCYSGLTGLTLHSRRPFGDWTMDELFIPITAVGVLDRVASRDTCVVYVREGDAFRARTFLPDGRPLPAVDADSKPLRVMPADALSAFLRDSAPTGFQE